MDDSFLNSLSTSVFAPFTQMTTELLKQGLESIFSNLNHQSEVRDAINDIAPLVFDLDESFYCKLENKYLKFRTLLSREIDMHIADVYQPLRIQNKSRENNKPILVDENCKLDLPNITCIIGKAGQGKTTLLRKVFINTLRNKDGVFPLIITLRNIDFTTKKSLGDLVFDEFFALGLNLTKEVCDSLVHLKRINFLFDGFDEIADTHTKSALELIQSAYFNYNLQVIVTSRPHTEITLNPGITNFELLDLELSDTLNLIEQHPSINRENKDTFISVIESKEYIAKILITPILVDIFCSTYHSLTIEPKSLIDFYNELFQSLASTHDKLKIFYERKSKTNLDNQILEKITHAASYKLLTIKNDITFPSKELIMAFDMACKKLCIQASNSHLDVLNKTSLIKDEGQTYSFIHKSIIEFFAAKYITSLKEIGKIEFYEFLTSSWDSRFENTIKFLSEIDEEMFHLNFSKSIISKFNQTRMRHSLKLKTVDMTSVACLLEVNVIKIRISKNIKEISSAFLTEDELELLPFNNTTFSLELSNLDVNSEELNNFHLLKILINTLKMSSSINFSYIKNRFSNSIHSTALNLFNDNNDKFNSICHPISHERKIDTFNIKSDIDPSSHYYAFRIDEFLNLPELIHLKDEFTSQYDFFISSVDNINSLIENAEASNKKRQSFDF